MTSNRSAAHGLLSVVVEQYRRHVPITFEVPCSYKDIRQRLAREMTWDDFGHDSDWTDPSSKSQIGSRRGWEVGLLETVLGNGICMVARKPPSGKSWCIPPNPFA